MIFDDFESQAEFEAENEKLQHEANRLQKETVENLTRASDRCVGETFKLSKDLKPKEGYKESSGKLFYEIDWSFVTAMAERMASNKGKYEPFNWKKPMDIEPLKQATARHFIEVMQGNYSDDGREYGHLEAIACNMMLIMHQLKLKNVSMPIDSKHCEHNSSCLPDCSDNQ